MKKTFSSILDGADEKDLEGFFAGIEEKTPPGGAVGRIEAKVVGRSEKKTSRRRIPLFVAAACFLLAACAVFIAAALNRKAPDMSYPEAPAVKAGSDAADKTVPEDAVKLEAVPDPVDRFDTKDDLGEGTLRGADNGMTLREIYSGVGIFESGGTAYLYYLEGKTIYEMRDDGLRDTGVTVPETLLPFRSVCGDAAYLGGTFDCLSVERGLFKANLLTGKIEKIIDAPEIISSAAVCGDRIWYSTHPNMADFRYSLKCADLSTGEITVLIRDSDDPIGKLQTVGGDLFFALYNVGICRVSDGYLYQVAEAPDVRSFCISDGKIYVYEKTPDGTGATVRVSVFDGDGAVLGSKKVLNHAPNTEEGENNLYFEGASCDELTVYGGKVVSFDQNGIYLEDVENGTSEKIVSLSGVGDRYVDFMFRQFWQGYDTDEWIAEHREAVDGKRLYWYSGVSKTVFDGKLYVMFGDELTVYDGKEAKNIPFESAS